MTITNAPQPGSTVSSWHTTDGRWEFLRVFEIGPEGGDVFAGWRIQGPTLPGSKGVVGDLYETLREAHEVFASAIKNHPNS